MAPVLAVELPLPWRVFVRFEAAIPVQLLKTNQPSQDSTRAEWVFTRHLRVLGGAGVHF